MMKNKVYILLTISLLSIISFNISYAENDSINRYAYLELEGDSGDLYNLTDISPLSNPSYLCTSAAGNGSDCWSRYMAKGTVSFDIYDNSGNSLGTMALDGVVFATLNNDGTFSGSNSMMWGNADMDFVYGDMTYNGSYDIVLEYWMSGSSAFALLKYPDLSVSQFKVDLTDLISENKIMITGQNDVVVQSLEENKNYEINADGIGRIGFLNVTEYLSSASANSSDIVNYQIFVGNIKTDHKLINAWGKSWQNTTSGRYHRLIYGYVAEEYLDADNDSYYSDTDCNDSDSAVNPAASDNTQDGIDNDCDGSVDEHYSAPSDDNDDDDYDSYLDAENKSSLYSASHKKTATNVPQKVIPVEAPPAQPAPKKTYSNPAETGGNSGFFGITGAVVGAISGNTDVLKSIGVVFWIIASLLLAFLVVKKIKD